MKKSRLIRVSETTRTSGIAHNSVSAAKSTMPKSASGGKMIAIKPIKPPRETAVTAQAKLISVCRKKDPAPEVLIRTSPRATLAKRPMPNGTTLMPNEPRIFPAALPASQQKAINRRTLMNNYDANQANVLGDLGKGHL